MNVTVETAGGTSTTSPADEYTYVSTPTVTKVTPDEGPQAGNTKVTIEGTGFTGATAVKFGATAGTSLKVESPTELTIESPAGTGTVNVTVETPGGTSATSTADDFTYDPVPTVTKLTPAEGPLSGETKVTISGTGFTSASTATFGASPAAGVIFDSETEITATAPATVSAGSVNVEVTTPGGTSVTSPADEYTYASIPTVSKVEPDEGPEAGKTKVTVKGTGFTDATAVKFGATAGTSLKVESPTELTIESPAGTGTVNVTVESPGGTSATSTADDYTYDPLPTVSALSVKEGPLAGGTATTITGTGFTPTSSVSFGGVKAKASTYVSPTELNVESPAGTGTVNVTVETPGGTSTTSAADDFTYVSTPTVTKVEPAEGPEAGKTKVTIEGSGFDGATAVKFGATAGTSLKVESPTELTIESPAGTGTVNVTVESPGGTSATSTADDFTYDPVPTVTKLNPADGPLAGETSVKITGTGFTASSTVTFGPTPAAGVIFDSETEITATAPATVTAGPVNVEVSTAGGTSATSAADEYTYVSTPTVTKVTPDEGPQAGNTKVTIEGTGFTGATAVKFGATAGTSLKVESPTELTIESPAGTGTVNVTVESPAARAPPPPPMTTPTTRSPQSVP